MSLSRDDWRSLSGLFADLEGMILRANWDAEPDLRQRLAVWLRDHDMPAPILEAVRGGDMPYVDGVSLARPSLVEFDLESTELLRGEVVYLGCTRDRRNRHHQIHGAFNFILIATAVPVSGKYQVAARVEMIT